MELLAVAIHSDTLFALDIWSENAFYQTAILTPFGLLATTFTWGRTPQNAPFQGNCEHYLEVSTLAFLNETFRQNNVPN